MFLLFIVFIFSYIFLLFPMFVHTWSYFCLHMVSCVFLHVQYFQVFHIFNTFPYLFTNFQTLPYLFLHVPTFSYFHMFKCFANCFLLVHTVSQFFTHIPKSFILFRTFAYIVIFVLLHFPTDSYFFVRVSCIGLSLSCFSYIVLSVHTFSYVFMCFQTFFSLSRICPSLSRALSYFLTLPLELARLVHAF